MVWPIRVEQAIVLADGVVGARDAIDAAWPGWAAIAPFVIAADGGARHASPLRLTMDQWVGDGDSLGDAGVAASFLRYSSITAWQLAPPNPKELTPARRGTPSRSHASAWALT